MLVAFQVSNADDDDHYLHPTQIFENRILFGSVIVGALTLIPVIHIPSVAENIVYQAPMTWEWALVLGACVVFMFCSEAYKAWIRPRIVRWVKM